MEGGEGGRGRQAEVKEILVFYSLTENNRQKTVRNRGAMIMRERET